MAQHKILFGGPVGAGKSTAIGSISDIPVICTNESASDMTRGRKGQTTVAMDYGLLKLDNGQRVHLYGTPGQERFDFMWEILSEGGIGLVLLVGNAKDDPFRDLRFFVDAFRDFIDQTAVVVGVTCMDVCSDPDIEAYNRELEALGIRAPIFEVDARDPQDVSALLEALLHTLDPGLK